MLSTQEPHPCPLSLIYPSYTDNFIDKQQREQLQQQKPNLLIIWSTFLWYFHVFVNIANKNSIFFSFTFFSWLPYILDDTFISGFSSLSFSWFRIRCGCLVVRLGVSVCVCVRYIKIQRKTFAVSHHGKSGGLTLDWQTGFALAEGADAAIVWQYKFSQLRGSSDDGKSKLKLHFQDHETRAIETKVSNHTRIRKF